jgi:hypothetical protein
MTKQMKMYLTVGGLLLLTFLIFLFAFNAAFASAQDNNPYSTDINVYTESQIDELAAVPNSLPQLSDAETQAVNTNNRILFIGDSITIKDNNRAPAAMANALGVTFGMHAANKKTSCDYGSSYPELVSIQEQIRNEGIRYVSIQLGANDSLTSTDPGVFTQCITNIVQAVTDTGVTRVLLNTPIYIGGVGFNSAKDRHFIEAYRQKLADIEYVWQHKGKPVFYSDAYSYVWFSQNQGAYEDQFYIHPNAGGLDRLGEFWARGFRVSEALDTTGCPKNNQCTTLRIFNPWSGEHLYSADQNEVKTRTREGWQFENIAWTTPLNGNKINRVYNSRSGEHLFTPYDSEVTKLCGDGWYHEGTAFYGAGSPTAHPIYRVFNPGSGEHVYTIDKNEVNVLSGQRGWRNEGVQWYAL